MEHLPIVSKGVFFLFFLLLPIVALLSLKGGKTSKYYALFIGASVLSVLFATIFVLYIINAYLLIENIVTIFESLSLVVCIGVFAIIIKNINSISILKSPKYYTPLLELVEQQKVEIKELDQALSGLEQRTGVCNWVWNPYSANGGSVKLSKTAKKVFGIADLSVDLESLLDMVVKDDRARFLQFKNDLLTSTEFIETYVCLLKGQQKIDVAIWGRAKYDIDGEVEYIYGQTQDITEKVKNLKLISSNRDLLQEISIIQSHTIRSQVATILGLIEIFNLDDYDDEKNKVVIEGIRVATNNLDTKIKELSGMLKI